MVLEIFENNLATTRKQDSQLTFIWFFNSIILPHFYFKDPIDPKLQLTSNSNFLSLFSCKERIDSNFLTYFSMILVFYHYLFPRIQLIQACNILIFFQLMLPILTILLSFLLFQGSIWSCNSVYLNFSILIFL